MAPERLLELVADWSNANQGLVSLAIFAVTIGFGWASGIFDALRRRPKFRFRLIEGPTFCCTFDVGKKSGEHDVHRTGIALYLHIANVGSAPSSIETVHIAYHWPMLPFTKLWWKYSVGWFWLTDQATAISDFQVAIGGHIKFFPFLFQRSGISQSSADTYLEVGKSTNGVVYFEQQDSFGGCFPLVLEGKVPMKVKLIDAFGKSYTRKFMVPSVGLSEARVYNPTFGQTLAELRGEPLPFDRPSDDQSTEMAAKG